MLLSGAALLCGAALPKPDDEPGSASLAGQLLVATPEMADPRFRRSVILMVKHAKAGALGVAVNRPIEDMPWIKLLAAIGQSTAGVSGRVTVYAGGPVELQVGFVIHSVEYRIAGTIDIDGRVAATPNPAVLRDLAHGNGPKQSLIAFGYAGWGPQQLEGEIARGGWFTVPEEPRFVFDMDRDKLWDEMSKRRTYPL
jgi:putative transcriptional regulator